MNSSHTTTQCPQRSMAWLKVDNEDQILSATKEMIQLLGYDPTTQFLDTIWESIETDQTYQIVSTIHTQKTLSICEHQELDNKRTLICTDVTDLDHMYTNRHHNVCITRLTMYGTIEAAFQSTPILSVGQPMMRYIHSDDVQEFCASLNEASKSQSIVSVRLRLDQEEENNQEAWSEFTVMAIEGGRKILCVIRPIENDNNITLIQQTQRCENILGETVTHIQSKLWYAIEHGMAVAARNIATSMVLLIQTLWQLWYDKEHQSWTGLFATSSEYVLRKVVQCTKERPELDSLCRLVSYTGVSQETSRSFIDHTLDHTTEWLLSKAYVKNVGYDTVV